MSPELQLQHDSGQGDFRGYCTMVVFPVWRPAVTMLAAETRPTPELPIIEVLTTTQFNLSTANSEVHCLGGKRHIHPFAFSATQTKPFTRVRAEQQDEKALEKLKSFLQQTFAWGPHLGSEYRHTYFQAFGQGEWLEARLRTTSSRRVQHRARPLVGTATGHINLSPSICIQQSSGHGFVGSSSLIQAFVREVIAVKLSAFTSTKAYVKM